MLFHLQWYKFVNDKEVTKIIMSHVLYTKQQLRLILGSTFWLSKTNGEKKSAQCKLLWESTQKHKSILYVICFYFFSTLSCSYVGYSCLSSVQLIMNLKSCERSWQNIYQYLLTVIVIGNKHCCCQEGFCHLSNVVLLHYKKLCSQFKGRDLLGSSLSHSILCGLKTMSPCNDLILY